MVKIEIYPSTAYLGMFDLKVTKDQRFITILCNNLDAAFKTLKKDAKTIKFLLD